MSWHRHGLYIFMTFALVAAIAWGALRDVPPIPKLFSGQDKLEHFLAFGALMFWVSALLKPSRWGLAMTVSVLAAISLEAGQGLLTQSRSASLRDFMASCAGVLAATIFIFLVRKTIRMTSAT